MTKENNFDGLRLISALLVLISHQFALSGRFEIRAIADHSFGNIGLLCFFSISGYLVSLSWERDSDPIRFLFRRFLRIAPGIVASYMITYVVLMILDILNFPYNPLHAINGSLWTIPLEILCYLLLMLLGIVFRQPATAFFFIMLITWLISGGQSTHLYLAYFGLFFGAGALCKQYPKLLNLKFLVILCCLGIILIMKEQTIIGLVFFTPSIISIGIQSWFLINKLGYFGDLSYGVYLYAWPVQQLYIHYLGIKTDYSLLLSLSIITTLIMAYCSWHLIEKKCLQLKSRRFNLYSLKTSYDILKSSVLK